MATAWKYLARLQESGLALNEVESQAWNRQANRMSKLGTGRHTLQKGRYGKEIQRDEKYVQHEMQERIRQAKEDWWQVRASFLNLKTQLMSDANNDLEKNRIKREVNKMKKQSEEEF